MMLFILICMVYLYQFVNIDFVFLFFLGDFDLDYIVLDVKQEGVNQFVKVC